MKGSRERQSTETTTRVPHIPIRARAEKERPRRSSHNDDPALETRRAQPKAIPCPCSSAGQRSRKKCMPTTTGPTRLLGAPVLRRLQPQPSESYGREAPSLT